MLSSGFDAEVRKANESEVGKRNGGAMLSMQVGGWIACMLWVAGAAGNHLWAQQFALLRDRASMF